jgi:hypothetical protein
MNSKLKNTIKKGVIASMIAAVPFAFSPRNANTAESTRLSIYSNSYALVNQQISLYLNKGETMFRIEIPEGTDLQSVFLRSLGTGFEMTEQNFLPGEITEDLLLKDYLGKNIRVFMKNNEPVSGLLLQQSGALYLKNDKAALIEIKADEIAAISYPNARSYAREPSLEWVIESGKATNGNFNLNFITKGISWNTEYFAILNNDESKINLESIVTLTNNSGKDFNDANVTLIAGQPNFQAGNTLPNYRKDESISAPADGITQQNVFEYHSYLLPAAVDLKDAGMRQVDFIDASGVPVDKEFILAFNNYYGAYSDIQKANADIKIILTNDDKSNLGMPLPSGKIKFYKESSGSMLDFIGEASMGHTSEGDTLEMVIGKAFDIKGEKKQVLYEETLLSQQYPSSRQIKYGYEVKVSNAKETAEKVSILETIPLNSKITSANMKYEMVTSTLARFTMDVAKQGSSTLNYQFIQTVN